ncbi:MAG: hypothetical protein J6S75_00625, partial [Thermoguttaceae bacterium]|nr:hypothetical protein [Thermoguttaceae bacterium]
MKKGAAPVKSGEKRGTPPTADNPILASGMGMSNEGFANSGAFGHREKRIGGYKRSTPPKKFFG